MFMSAPYPAADGDNWYGRAERPPPSHAKAPAPSEGATRVSVQSSDFQSGDAALPPATFDPYTGQDLSWTAGSQYLLKPLI